MFNARTLSTVILAAALIFVYGLCSRLAERTVITAPMVVVAVGLLLGPRFLNLCSIHSHFCRCFLLPLTAFCWEI